MLYEAMVSGFEPMLGGSSSPPPPSPVGLTVTVGE
jgi:hypothetical protein